MAIMYIHTSETMSDVKSHKAEAAWALLSKMFKHINFSNTEHMCVARVHKVRIEIERMYF